MNHNETTALDTFGALFGAFLEEDEETVRALIADDAVWHFPGRTGQLSGSHRGVEAILGFLRKVGELTGGTFEAVPEQVIASESSVVVLFTGTASRQGRELSNPTCLVLDFDAGKLVNGREFVWDLDHVEAFWA